MPPEPQDRQAAPIPQQPASAQPPEAFPFATATRESQRPQRNKRVIAVLVAVALLVIISLIIGALLLRSAPDNSSQKKSQAAGVTKDSSVEDAPVELVPFSNESLGVSMKTPRDLARITESGGDSEIITYRGVTIEADATDNSVKSQSLGRRIEISTSSPKNQFVIDNSDYEIYLQTFKNEVSSLVDDPGEGSKVTLNYEKETTVAGYKTYIAETVTKHEDSAHSTDHVDRYVYIFINSEVNYTFRFQSDVSDSLFQKSIDEMTDSIKIG